MNIALLTIYLLSLLTIKNIKNLFIFLILLIVYLFGNKIYGVYSSSTLIENELFAPLSLTSKGSLVLAALASPSSIDVEADICITKQCAFSNRKVDLNIAHENNQLIETSRSPSETKEWILKNQIMADKIQAFRGKFLHHYSSVLYPYHEFRDGNYAPSFYSQYGLISVIPLIFMTNTAFTYYGIIGLVLVLLIGTLLIYLNRGSSKNCAIIALILSVVALTTDVGAIRISSGFSAIRYMPFIAIFYLFARALYKSHNLFSLIICAFLAAINSIQFNMLSIAIVVSAYGYIYLFKNPRIDSKIFRLPAVVLGITIVQVATYYFHRNSFTPPLFSSVGEGGSSALYTLSILLFPLILKMSNYIQGRNIHLNEINYTNEEILGFIGFGLSATYAISFPNSPQHYSGFILMASCAIYIILKNNLNTIFKSILILSLFLYIPYHYRYLNIGQHINFEKSVYFDYKNDLGDTINFKTAMEIGSLSKNYDDVLSKANGKKTFFISKDKIYIEAYKGKNLLPKVYDVFTNYVNIDAVSSLKKMRDDGVDYVVLDNSQLRYYSAKILDIFQPSIGEVEYDLHKKILENINSLASMLDNELVYCNSRYCLYKTK